MDEAGDIETAVIHGEVGLARQSLQVQVVALGGEGVGLLRYGQTGVQRPQDRRGSEIGLALHDRRSGGTGPGGGVGEQGSGRRSFSGGGGLDRDGIARVPGAEGVGQQGAGVGSSVGCARGRDMGGLVSRRKGVEGEDQQERT